MLVDARAGMAELSAGPLLGLGATVFLFGTAQRQTIEDYRYLFAHLATFPPDAGGRLTVAAAAHGPRLKAPLSDEVNTVFTDEMWDLFTEYLYEEIDGLDGFNFDVNDPKLHTTRLPFPSMPASSTGIRARKPT